MTPLSQKFGEKQGSAVKVGPHLSFLKPFNTKKRLAWELKKILHYLFCVFQTKLNKAVDIFCRLSELIRNVQMIRGFSTIKTCMRILMGNSKD